jgi:D-3-phosphoglycerate dehydrogenase
MRILLLENVHPVAHDALRAEGFEVEVHDGSLSESELVERLRDVHAVGIRSKTQLAKAVFESAPNLLAVGAFCIGTNQIDLETASAHGVGVFNAPFSNTRSVAELVMAEIVMLSRQLGDRVQEMHQGKWRKIATGAHEVRGKSLGIIGYGHIGRQIGVLAEAFGMFVRFFDVAQQLPMGNNVPSAELDALLAEADFVTLHVPATSQTHEMIGARELALMKPGACLLNASRGTVVVIEALAETLRSGHLAGAAIDVFPVEPKKNTSDDFASPLVGIPNVILTPHIGGSTLEAQENIGREVSAALARYLRLGTTLGSVNLPPVDLARAPGGHRVANVHRNVPGVLRDINKIVSDAEANVQAQILATTSEIGYLVMDMERDVAEQVCERMRGLSNTIRARSLGG